MLGRRRLLLVSQPLHAGVPNYVRTVVDGLAGADLEIDVACPRSSTLWRDLAGRPGVSLHAIAAARAPSPVDAASLRRLVTLVRRADVVHAHSSKGGFLARLAAALTGRTESCLFTPHGWSYWVATGARGRAYLELERLAARWCAAIVTVSQYERENGLAAGVGRPEQYRVVRNGIAVDDFARPRTPVAGRIVALGRLSAPKRPDLALEALALVRRRHPYAELWLAGDGPLRGRVEELVRANGLTGAVRLLGESRDVPELLASAACLLLASDYEACPLSVLEGMAAGAPVVAARVGGVPELIEDGRTGLLVPPRDAGELARALDRVLGDPTLAGRLGARAQAQARTQFTRERMAGELLSLYLELPSRRR